MLCLVMMLDTQLHICVYKQCWLFAKLDFDMRFLLVPLESLLCRYVVFSDDAGHTVNALVVVDSTVVACRGKASSTMKFWMCVCVCVCCVCVCVLCLCVLCVCVCVVSVHVCV